MPASTRQLVKPPALRPGDTVGIVAPASNVKQSELEAGCEALHRAGYKPFYLDSILQRDLYFAGTATRRARELEEMFARDEVRAIICARGGYGANYLLQELDLAKVTGNPKIFVGYSDLTTLLTYFLGAGLVTFHGPMVAKDWSHEDGVNFDSWVAAVTQQRILERPSRCARGLAGRRGCRRHTLRRLSFNPGSLARHGLSKSKPRTPSSSLKIWLQSPIRSIAC